MEADCDVFARRPELAKMTPSRKDGIDEDTEMMCRIFGCELIQEATILLRLSQTVAATGQAIFHRFYFRRSLKEFDTQEIALACVMLACKNEEQPRRISDLLNVFHAMKMRRRGGSTMPLDPMSDEYILAKDAMRKHEIAILRELAFILHVEHAHKFILHYTTVVGGGDALPQRAWNYVNDAYRLCVCIQSAPEVVACAAVFLAARDLHIPLPSNPPWWILFGVEKEEMTQVAAQIKRLYTLPPARDINVRRGETFASVFKDSGDNKNGNGGR